MVYTQAFYLTVVPRPGEPGQHDEIIYTPFKGEVKINKHAIDLPSEAGKLSEQAIDWITDRFFKWSDEVRKNRGDKAESMINGAVWPLFE